MVPFFASRVIRFCIAVKNQFGKILGISHRSANSPVAVFLIIVKFKKFCPFWKITSELFLWIDKRHIRILGERVFLFEKRSRIWVHILKQTLKNLKDS